VLPQEIREGFVGNFLKTLAGVASDGPNRFKGLVVELNALSGHDDLRAAKPPMTQLTRAG
jgi:hypothetical protein